MTRLEHSILSKARWVSRRYSSLNFEDLVQEAVTLAVQLRRKHGSKATDAYINRAVQFHFGKLIRNARRDDKFITYNLDQLADSVVDPHDAYSYIDNERDKEKFIRTVKNKNLRNTLNGLLNGLSVAEIAERQNSSVRSIYRQIEALRHLWEEWSEL